MAGTGEHIKALVRSHAAGDDAAFYAVAMQVAAQEARRGHNQLAAEIKNAIDASRQQPVARKVTTIAQPRGDLADLVTATFPDVALRDLIVPPSLAIEIKRVLAEQRQRKELQSHGFSAVHRLLLEGPPGTGKTMTASVLAHELSLPLLSVRLDNVMSKYLGETASKLRVVFDAAEQQRAVFLFDEFDALGGDRTGNDIGEARRILNSFLVFLENASPDSVIVAATNHRGLLDRALFRRFDLVLTYDLPGPGDATAVLKERLGRLGKGTRWASLTAEAGGLSHSDLVKAAESAAKGTLMQRRDRVTTSELAEALTARRSATVG